MGLWLTGCQGNPLGDRLAVNPALQASPGSVTTPSPSPLASASPQNTPTVTVSGKVSEGNHLDDASRQALEDLAKLGIIPSPTDPSFQPHNPITRREFARWLFMANNRFFADLPGKQIRQASPSSNPVFTDLPKTDKDFGMIQGLAEAGLIPSPLSNDPSA
ncbi:MAG: S-layer homology domain-containing protein, partial [Microcystaceae cyanobacterium]